MKKFLFIFLAFFLGCKAVLAETSADAIPEGCSNAVLFMQDVRFSLNRSDPDKLLNYYLDDVEEIRNIFASWPCGKKVSAFPKYFDSGFLCDFDFFLIIDGLVQPCPIQGICIRGNIVKVGGKGYEFNSDYWEKLKPKLKLVKRKVINCPSANEYRITLEEIRKDKNYIYSENNFSPAKQSVPDQYDGYFYVSANTGSFSKIEKSISKKYPGKAFRIGEQLGSGPWIFSRSCEYQIYASREFYEMFDLYPKGDYVQFKDIKLTVYEKEAG